MLSSAFLFPFTYNCYRVGAELEQFAQPVRKYKKRECFSKLYDRCILLYTTFIPYRKFEEVLGIKGIDEYIRYGGTMSLGGINYNNDFVFDNNESVNKYVDSAIGKYVIYRGETQEVNGIHYVNVEEYLKSLA